MTTVKSIFNLEAPQEVNLNAPKSGNPFGARLIGLELETENIAVNPSGLYVKGLHGVADGSLRNLNGRTSHEFITYPMTYDNTIACLQKFFAVAKFNETNYTERCSVHVHVNCQDMTPEQLTTLCLLYQVFEPLLFAFVGSDRDKNIFCVPWTESILSYRVIQEIMEAERYKFEGWQKYTALNLIPLRTQGTVEFRHMPGTCDLDFIKNWLNILGCMFKFATEQTLTTAKDAIINLNTTSQYENVLDAVFGAYSSLFKKYDYFLLLEDGVLSVKFILLGEQNYEETKTRLKNRPLLGAAPAGDVGGTVNPVDFQHQERIVPQQRLGPIPARIVMEQLAPAPLELNPIVR